MSAPRRLMTWIREHPRAADWMLMLLLQAIAIPMAFYAEVGPGQRQLGIAGWVLVIAMNIPVVWRRTAPVAALWTTVACTAPFWVLDYPDDPAGPNLLILVYSLAAHEGRPRSIRHFWGAFAVMTGVLVAGVISVEEDLPWIAVPANVIVFGTAWILGDNLRTRRQYLAELEEKAARNEDRQRAEAQRAVIEERTRIARELHDVVAHSMSVMVVQAGAARRILDVDPARASEALATIEETGRESLTEMRRMLGVLRDHGEEAELAPQPGLDDFDRLLQTCGEAGLPVELVVTGEVRHLAPGLEMNAFRVVQESLTNSLKHAGTASAVVRLHYRPDALEVDVTDDGRGAAAVSGGSGQGLVGMRERVEAYGGHLSAEPRPGGGFAVSATFFTEPS